MHTLNLDQSLLNQVQDNHLNIYLEVVAVASLSLFIILRIDIR